MTLVAASHLEACLELAELKDPLGERVKEALEVVYDVLETYGEEHVSVSFNGGKDCTVLLHLYAAALHRRNQGKDSIHVAPPPSDSSPSTSTHPSQPSPPYTRPISSIYIAPPSPFTQLETFVAESERRYNLSLYRITPPPDAEKGGEGMKHALKVYKAEFPDIVAILVGTRRNDPHGGKLAYKNPTDGDWPRFMRVHPIIDWSYADVWAFLRRLNVPYCDLYDAGYTSLGSTYNTYPNPALWRPQKGAEDQESYRPAYELGDETLERAGRGQRFGSGSLDVPSSVLPSPVLELANPTSRTAKT